MATLLEDLTDIEEKAQGLVENKVANFAYTQEAYDNDDVDGVSEYDVNKAQNIPTAEAETLDVNLTVLNKGYRSQASSITRMLMNHFLGRTSYNLNKSVDLFKKGFLGIKNALGKPSGIATLDENGYLSKEQRLPVLTKEKLKEFLFSGKEISYKELDYINNPSLSISTARSINEKEDVILITVSNIIRAFKYDGETLSEIDNVSFPSAPKFICEYKNYALFACSQQMSSSSVVHLTKFNFVSLEIETTALEVAGTAQTITFNKNKECWEILPETINVSTTEEGHTQTTLVSVDLSFVRNDTTLYIPNQVHSGVSDITNYTIISGGLLALYQENAPVYNVFVYHISDLEVSGNNERTLITLNKVPCISKRKGTKNFILQNQLSNDIGTAIIEIDNGNIYEFNIYLNLHTSYPVNYIEGDYLILGGRAEDNETAITRIYKNGKLCTELLRQTSDFTNIYDSIFYASGCLYDVENSNNVISKKLASKIVKSDRRAYTIRNINIGQSQIFEITNVLD